MGARGRQSTAAIAVVRPSGITAINRPSPPGVLTNEQAHEWRTVVNRMPADWFPSETHAMLIQYCRHVASAQHVASMIENYMADQSQTIDSFNKLLLMQEREGRALSALATRMRISQQAQFTNKKTIGDLLPQPPHES